MGGAGNGKHTQSIPRDTPGRCSLEQGSGAIFAHVGVARTLIKLMGYKHREDAVGVGEKAPTHTHTHTHTQCPSLYTGWMEPQVRIGHILDTCRRGPQQIKLMGFEHRRNAMVVGGASNGKHTHTHSLPLDTSGGCTHEQGSDAI